MQKLLPILLFAPLLSSAQQAPSINDALSLREAVQRALAGNQSIEAASAAEKVADIRIAEARAGNLPKVNYTESWARSDNPVFVFSSLLTQHQFGAQNFAIGALNQPDFLNNFQSQLTADQPLYDAGETKRAIHAASLGRDFSAEDMRSARMSVIAAVVRSYDDVLLSTEQLNAARQALRSAQADLDRAESIRAAGLSTDADVLSIRVHLAGVQEEQIRREAALDVAGAALNDALGLPLDTAHQLSGSLTPVKIPAAVLADYEKNAVADRPELREAKLATSLAENQIAAAHGNLLPRMALHTAFEADRQRFYDRGGENWLVSIGLRWNLFNGFSDRARVEESVSALHKSQAEAQRADSAIRLQVRRAWADLRAAAQRMDVSAASVAEAEESLRITQNRYESGLNNVTDLLRTETALLDARTRRLAAVHDERLAATMLELAAGTLSVDSDVLNEGSR